MDLPIGLVIKMLDRRVYSDSLASRAHYFADLASTVKLKTACPAKS
jgi:hypothetical protein